MMNSKNKHPLWVFLQEKGRIWLLLGAALAGILLLLLGNAFSDKEELAHQSPASSEEDSLALCEAELEERLREICSEVAGVGQVDVMLHLESGARVVYTEDANGNPLTTGTGASREPVYATLLSPKVAGVAIVCRGGDDPRIREALTDLVSTALNISAARVCVLGK